MNYLSGHLTKKTVKDLKYKTAGQLQDLMILEKIIEHYNDGVGYGVVTGPTIGVEKKDSLFSQWKDDDIHNKSGAIVAFEEESEGGEDDD